MNNPNLKQVGVKTAMTVEQAIEYVNCANDPIYFITKYLKTISLDHGEVPFELYDYQRDFINSIHKNRFVLARWGRQMGKCVRSDVRYNVRNKKTGEVLNVSAEEFHNMQKKANRKEE